MFTVLLAYFVFSFFFLLVLWLGICVEVDVDRITTSSEEFVRRILKASRLSNRRFNNWYVIRGEIVYTVRFPLQMHLYVKDSFSSFFR